MNPMLMLTTLALVALALCVGAIGLTLLYDNA